MGKKVDSNNTLIIADTLRGFIVPPSYMHNVLEAELNLRIAMDTASKMEHKDEDSLRDICEAHVLCMRIIERYNEKGE